MDPPRRQRWRIQVQKEPGASLRRDSEELGQLADRGAGVKLTCQDAAAANVGTAAAARGGGGKRRAARPARPPRVPITPAPLPRAPLRGCSLLTLDADARDTAKNKKKGPAPPQTALLRGAQERSGAREAEPGGSGRPGEGGSRAGRCGAGLEPTPVKGCGPGASRGGRVFPGPGAGSLGAGPGSWRDKKREGSQGDRGEGRQARAPPTHLLPRLRRPLGAAGARLPARPGRSPTAAGLVLPSARGSVRRRRVRGLRSGESPPLASARGARRRRPREREEARPGPRPDSRPRGARALARGR